MREGRAERKREKVKEREELMMLAVWMSEVTCVLATPEVLILEAEVPHLL
jgi:hypothetical protein